MVTEEQAREKIGIALGRVSMCWEGIEQAGIFKSTECAEIIEDLMVDLELKEIPPS